MIGTRAGRLASLAAIVALVPLAAGGDVGPASTIAARLLVETRAAAAERELAGLEAGLAPAVDMTRRGAAAVVSGDAPPGPTLAAAASDLAAREPLVTSARSAVARLDGAVRAADPQAAPVDLDIAPGELASIATQLDATAPAADRFVEMRGRADRAVASLDDAFAALERGDVAAGEQHVAAARADLDAVAGWDVDIVTLPVWVETTDGLVDAAEAILAATRAGDGAGAARAAEAFVDRSAEAEEADRALRIAIGEGGSAVTAAPLGRLAEVLRAVADTRAQVAPILHSIGR